jgi:hypothetical protein
VPVHHPHLAGSTLLLLVGVTAVAVPAAVVRTQARYAAAGSSNGTGTVTQSPTASPAAAAAKDPKDPKDKDTFAISGTVDGLVPGVPKPMTVRIDNPNSWSIQVLTIDATAGSTGRANCPASTLSVTPYAYASGPGVFAPGKGFTTIILTVTLADSLTLSQADCPGAKFPLAFTGTAEKAKP